jgi:hypothetical protein
VKAKGFAVVEVLVAVLVVGIVATTAVLVVGGMHTHQVNHACFDEAQRYQNLVRDYGKRHHGAIPAVKESRHSKPTVDKATLVMFKDDKGAGPITTFDNGDGPNHWQYDAETGDVTMGKSCR